MKSARWLAAALALTGALAGATIAGAGPWPDKEARDAAAAESFPKADVDGNGALSADELATFHTLMEQRRKSGFIAHADANGDGQLTLEELQAARPPHGGCNGGPPPE